MSTSCMQVFAVPGGSLCKMTHLGCAICACSTLPSGSCIYYILKRTSRYGLYCILIKENCLLSTAAIHRILCRFLNESKELGSDEVQGVSRLTSQSPLCRFRNSAFIENNARCSLNGGHAKKVTCGYNALGQPLGMGPRRWC